MVEGELEGEFGEGLGEVDDCVVERGGANGAIAAGEVGGDGGVGEAGAEVCWVR